VNVLSSDSTASLYPRLDPSSQAVGEFQHYEDSPSTAPPRKHADSPPTAPLGAAAAPDGAAHERHLAAVRGIESDVKAQWEKQNAEIKKCENSRKRLEWADKGATALSVGFSLGGGGGGLGPSGGGPRAPTRPGGGGGAPR